MDLICSCYSEKPIRWLLVCIQVLTYCSIVVTVWLKTNSNQPSTIGKSDHTLVPKTSFFDLGVRMLTHLLRNSICTIAASWHSKSELECIQFSIAYLCLRFVEVWKNPYFGMRLWREAFPRRLLSQFNWNGCDCSNCSKSGSGSWQMTWIVANSFLQYLIVGVIQPRKLPKFEVLFKNLLPISFSKLI